MLPIVCRFLGVAALLLLAGCAPDTTAEVSGTVTFDGQPLETGAVQFSPVDGQSPTAGAVIKDGWFTSRVPVGEMKVTFTAPKVVGKKKLYNSPTSPEAPITEELLPEKYNAKSELKTQVKPGRNPVVFELTSGK